MKKRSKGFTLAELLIVIAVLALLVGIGIPLFVDRLVHSRATVDSDNIRSAYASLVADVEISGDEKSAFVELKSKPIKDGIAIPVIGTIADKDSGNYGEEDGKTVLYPFGTTDKGSKTDIKYVKVTVYFDEDKWDDENKGITVSYEPDDKVS